MNKLEPHTKLQILVASILQTKLADPIQINKLTQYIINNPNENITIYNPNLERFYEQYSNLPLSNVVGLSRFIKFPHLKTNTNNQELNDVELLDYSKNSIFEFEKYVLDNKIKYQYSEKYTFAQYLYKNLLARFGVENSSQITVTDSWMFPVIKLLELSNFDSDFARSLFIFDNVQIGGQSYNVSNVPKFEDIYNVHQHRMHLAKINYNDIRNKFKQTFNEFWIPDEESKLLAWAIPLYDNYRLDTMQKIKLRYNESIEETLLFNQATSHSFNCAVNMLSELNPMMLIKKSLENDIDQSLLCSAALTILCGSQLTFNSIEREETIKLMPIEYIKAWFRQRPTEISIPRSSILNTNIRNGQDLYLKLVKYIVDVAQSKIGAASVCSIYHIPIIILSNLLKKRKLSDAEKYVLITLYTQYYDNIDLENELNTLNPIFGNNQHNPNNFREFQPLNLNLPTKIQDFNNMNTNNISELDVDQNGIYPLCVYDMCISKYEFSNPSLRQLVLGEPLEDLPPQITATYIINILKLPQYKMLNKTLM